MRRLLRTLTLATAAFWAAVAVYVGLTLPPRSIHLDAKLPGTHILGAYHIHTARSDGTGTVESVAAAAARAGLQFVVFTDHADATRAPDPPIYRNGVLCIDAIEINTREGHLVALGLTTASPFPLAGAARDVIDDIHRMGGMAVLAHPDSPSDNLRWRGANQAFDGIEWLNVDSEWRDETPLHLAVSAARAIFRAPETIATLLTRPVRTLQRWDGAARQRPVFGLAALDAHARIGWRETEEPRQRTALAQPTYESMFRTLAQVAVLDAPLSGRAADDAERVVGALEHGQSYAIIRALAQPAALTFAGEQGSRAVPMGQRLTASDVPVTLRARVDGAPGARLTIFADGQSVATGSGQVTATATRPGVYRVEGMLQGVPVPWLVSNPIVIAADAPTRADAAAPVPAAMQARRTVPLQPDQWTIEREASSEGLKAADGPALRFDFLLGGGAPHGQYAAVVTPIHESTGADRIEFVGRASQPMRVSVQVRLPGGRDGERWRRSVYLDQTPRSVSLRLEDFEPADRPTTRRPVVALLQSLLFVADTVNTLPGQAGTLWLSDVQIGVTRLDQ